MTITQVNNLFKPIKVGFYELQHRVVFAPTTRLRNTATGEPLIPLVAEYYAQRASTPGTLIISEGTIIAAKAAGFPYTPGIWSDSQIANWKKVVDAVHAKGSFIFLQIAALGRAAMPAALKAFDPSFEVVGPSAVPYSQGDPTVRALTEDEIQEYIQLFVTAARNAVELAGFDGVEIHGANGFLVDEFIQDHTNIRNDSWGGSIENRSRFPLEVIRAVSEVIGQQRIALRLSPWSTAQDMGMEDPKPQFSYLVEKVKEKYPSLAYLHLVEPRVAGIDDREPEAHESNDFIRKIWAPLPLVTAGGHTRELALKLAEQHPNELFAFGRFYIANPDLPRRLKENIPLNPYDRATFYIPEDASGVGYTDYPFAP